MANISIYVPNDLKARMDKAPDTSWSAVARRAFELEVNGGSPKGSRQERSWWIEAGRRWAIANIDSPAIHRVADIGNSARRSDSYDLLQFAVVDAIADLSVDESTRDYEEEVFRIIFGEEAPSFDRLLWWVEGATQVRNELKTKV